jgi:hypothetical protein
VLAGIAAGVSQSGISHERERGVGGGGGREEREREKGGGGEGRVLGTFL